MRYASANLKMQVAGVSQTVNVMGSSPIVDTQSAAGGVTIDQAMMNQLPVSRSFYQLARIAPGVTTDLPRNPCARDVSRSNLFFE